MYVNQHRRVATAACTALLTAGLAGCSSLDRTAVGPVDHLSTDGQVVVVNSPLVKGCHRFSPVGASAVKNGTLVDLIVYHSSNCTGGKSAYIATELSNSVSAGTPPWRSYRFVH